MKKYELHCADALVALSFFDDNSVDSLVTDPPAGISFMGKAWDDDKGGRKQWCAWMTEVMQECLRVMKPGAHGLVWAIPRTSHWTGCALEDAGFEVRDVISHLFGSGFPKSLDISKAIDKAAGAEREIIGIREDFAARANKKRVGQNFMDETVFDGSFSNPETVGQITAPATEEAKQWQGYGTALKPACEMWFLVRKPLSEKTVAANVIKWGVGGLNIDGCRIDLKNGETTHGSGVAQSKTNTTGYADMGVSRIGVPNIQSTQGRFPANLVLSHNPDCEDDQCSLGCAVAMLDAQSGFLVGAGNKKASPVGKGSFGMGHRLQDNKKLDSGGGASRFFYCAKTSTAERNAAGPNGHPTVKAQKLIRYLCRLITPPNGVVLDPFMGSGSTGLAALSEGFRFVGIEKEQEYFEISKKRINHDD